MEQAEGDMNAITFGQRRNVPAPPSRSLFSAVAAMLVLFHSPAIAPADDAALRDCVLTARARQVLLQDNVLAPLNLGVSVRSGVATLWGQVPTVGLGRRAEDKTRKVPGIREVHSELRIERADDPVAEFLRSATAAAQRPTLESFLPANPRPPAYLTRRWTEETTATPPHNGTGPGIVLLAPIAESQPAEPGAG